MHSWNVPPRQYVISRSAEVFYQYLAWAGVTFAEYCKALDLPQRTFENWMANRESKEAVGHTGRGPIKLLKKILDIGVLPDHVAEALRDVVEYPERFLRAR